MLDTLQHRRRDARLHMLCKTHHEDVAISKEDRLVLPKRTTRNMHPLSFQVQTAAATIESIPSSQELSEIGIHYLQTQQLPQHLLLSKHKLALSKIKNTSLKLPVGVSPLQPYLFLDTAARLQ